MEGVLATGVGLQPRVLGLGSRQASPARGASLGAVRGAASGRRVRPAAPGKVLKDHEENRGPLRQ